MHFHLSRAIKRLLLATWLLALASPRGEDLQFLFIVDLSPKMAARHTATVRTIHDLVLTAFHDRIQSGEHFAVWLNGATLEANHPFTWDLSRNQELARRASGLLASASYNRFDAQRQPLTDAIATSTNLTVCVLTDGYHRITGTTFDSEINAALSEHRDTFAREDKPFLITLLARDGKWISADVHTNLSAAVELPRPDSMTEALARVREVVANPTSPAELAKARASLRRAMVTPPVAAPAVVQPTPKPVVIETPVAPLQVEPVIAALPPPSQPEPKPSVVVELPAEKINEEKPPAPPVVTAAVVAPVTAPPPPVLVEAPAPKPAVPTNPPPSPKVQPKPIAKPVAAKVAPPKPTRHFPWAVLIAGIITIALGGTIAFLRARAREKSPGSLITQSLPPYPTRPGRNFPYAGKAR